MSKGWIGPGHDGGRESKECVCVCVFKLIPSVDEQVISAVGSYSTVVVAGSREAVP